MIQNTAELISKQDGLTLSVLWTEPEKKVRGAQKDDGRTGTVKTP